MAPIDPEGRPVTLIVDLEAAGVFLLPGLIVVPTVQARDAVLAVLNDTAREKA